MRCCAGRRPSFNNFRVVPPDTGIVHQVNLEYLAPVVFTNKTETGLVQAYPDTVMGTDSHTTMINGLGVVGWGVGGIEAEACMLGQPISMLLPAVVGFKLKGKLSEGTTATDLVLTVTQMLRAKGCRRPICRVLRSRCQRPELGRSRHDRQHGPRVWRYDRVLPDRRSDARLLAHDEPSRRADRTGRMLREGAGNLPLLPSARIRSTPTRSNSISSKVTPSLAGPKRPQDRIDLKDVKKNFLTGLGEEPRKTAVKMNGKVAEVQDGSVVIAAITSCTNTSNPSVMLAAGLLAKKAVEKGLTVQPHVKTSLAPGSKVVMDYYHDAGLTPYMEKLGFHLVGFGCTTCIGNSGPLPEEVGDAVQSNKLVVASVLEWQSQFRRPYQLVGTRELSCLAAAGRRLCVGGSRSM